MRLPRRLSPPSSRPFCPRPVFATSISPLSLYCSTLFIAVSRPCFAFGFSCCWRFLADASAWLFCFLFAALASPLIRLLFCFSSLVLTCPVFMAFRCPPFRSLLLRFLLFFVVFLVRVFGSWLFRRVSPPSLRRLLVPLLPPPLPVCCSAVFSFRRLLCVSLAWLGLACGRPSPFPLPVSSVLVNSPASPLLVCVFWLCCALFAGSLLPCTRLPRCVLPPWVSPFCRGSCARCRCAPFASALCIVRLLFRAAL